MTTSILQNFLTFYQIKINKGFVKTITDKWSDHFFEKWFIVFVYIKIQFMTKLFVINIKFLLNSVRLPV